MTPEDLIRRSILTWEGGYSDHQADKGGATKWGISEKAHPTVDIQSLTLEDAVTIAKDYYWDRMNLDGVKSDKVKAKLFDMAFNFGVARASRMAQEAAGVGVDGIIGEKSIAAINLLGAGFVNDLIEVSALRYARIVASDKSQAVFLMGWMRRAFDRIDDVA